MKYLKKYNESVEKKSLEDIKDIFQELEDNNFNVKISNRNGSIFISIVNADGEDFRYSDVKEVLLRLVDYLDPIHISGDVITYYEARNDFHRYDIKSFDENALWVYGYVVNLVNAILWDIHNLQIYFSI